MIVICWEQLPIYAARSIHAFVETSGQEVVVLTVPFKRFPIKGAEEQTGCRVIVVGRDDQRSLSELVGRIPEAILVGGWASPCFVRWAKDVRRSGGRVVLGTDEAFTDKSLKQRIRKLRFMWKFNALFDRIFVCGKGGLKQFYGWYGLPREKLITGFYGSDPLLFPNGKPLRERPKRFLFVGHFDHNKNVLPMCEAFLCVRTRHPEWELELCGGGELEPEIPKAPGIILTGFVQSEHLGEKYRNARCLVLGSFSEKWGVVVHEAVASGCMLILSEAVGSKYDFAEPENAVLFNPASVDALEAAMERIVAMTDEELAAAQAKSVELAAAFSPAIFAAGLTKALKGNF